MAPDGKLMAVAIHVDADGALNVGPPVALFQTRFPTGALINGVPVGRRPQYAVAPDGRFLMNVTVDDEAVSPISIVLNWANLLKK